MDAALLRAARDRRGFGTRYSFGSSAAAVAALRAYFTDAKLPAIYVPDSGVTVAAGLATTWSDVRGGGFGPDITFAAGHQPAYDGGNYYLTGDGSTVQGTTVASALFDTSGLFFLCAIGSLPTTTAFRYIAGVMADTALTNAVAIREDGTDINAVFGAAATQADTLVTGGPSIRLSIASKNASTLAHGQVPNHVKADATITANGVGNNTLTLFNYFAGGSGFIASNIKAVVVGKTDACANSADVSALVTFAQGLPGAGVVLA